MEIVHDLIASHIYAMRGMEKREIIEVAVPLWDALASPLIVKIKLKELKPSRPVRPKKDNAEMA